MCVYNFVCFKHTVRMNDKKAAVVMALLSFAIAKSQFF